MEGPALLSRAQALTLVPLLAVMPPEYLGVLPWRVLGGEPVILEDDLLAWCGDGDFAARAAAALQEREDAGWLQAQRREAEDARRRLDSLRPPGSVSSAE